MRAGKKGDQETNRDSGAPACIVPTGKTGEAAACGAEMRPKQEEDHSLRRHAASPALLDEPLVLREPREAGREAAVRQRAGQVPENRMDYML